MKKAQSVTKSKLPAALQAEIDERKARVAQQERNGNLDTYDHTELARLEKAAAQYQQSDEVK